LGGTGLISLLIGHGDGRIPDRKIEQISDVITKMKGLAALDVMKVE
jgi:hypothetical protein